jgi:hypothetical protein
VLTRAYKLLLLIGEAKMERMRRAVLISSTADSDLYVAHKTSRMPSLVGQRNGVNYHGHGRY